MGTVLTLLFLGIGSVYDVRNRELPGKFLFLFAVLGAICNVCFRYQSFFEICSGILLGGSFIVIGWLSKEAIGYGDGIGIVVTGVFVGGKKALLILSGAFFLSALYGIGKLLLGKTTISDTMPFYPFLFAAALGGILI